MPRISRRTLLGGSILAPLALSQPRAARAATPDDVLVVVGEQGPNSLDTHVPTANDYSRLVAWNA